MDVPQCRPNMGQDNPNPMARQGVILQCNELRPEVPARKLVHQIPMSFRISKCIDHLSDMRYAAEQFGDDGFLNSAMSTLAVRVQIPWPRANTYVSMYVGMLTDAGLPTTALILARGPRRKGWPRRTQSECTEQIIFVDVVCNLCEYKHAHASQRADKEVYIDVCIYVRTYILMYMHAYTRTYCTCIQLYAYTYVWASVRSYRNFSQRCF